MAKKKKDEVVLQEESEVVEHGFFATKDFEFGGKQYKQGGKFIVPPEWSRDDGFEEFRKINVKNSGNSSGISFSIPVPVMNADGNVDYFDSRRVILPLQEV